MSIYQSLTALILAGSISSCDCARNFENWKQEGAERVRLGKERDHLKKQGYDFCQGMEQDCFSVGQAQHLEKAGIKAEPANLLASLYIPVSEIIKWQEAGCKFERFSSLLKEARAKGLDTGAQNAGYYALAVCAGKTTFEELLKYQPRFRELKPGGKPEAVYLAQHNINAETANAFPRNYNAREMVTLTERGKKADVALKYAETKKEYSLEAVHIADLDDQQIAPKTLRWYFDLEKEFPAIKIEVSEILTLEKAVQEKKLTRNKVKELALRVQEEEEKNPVLELLRRKVFSPPEFDLSGPSDI